MSQKFYKLSYHFYKCIPGERPEFLPDVQTIPQARKVEFAYPSVTTILSLFTDPFMARWRNEKLFNMDPDSCDFDEAMVSLYGYRKCPETGEQIPSSEFGTRAHARMEAWANCEDIGDDPYDSIISEVIEKFKEMKAVPEVSEYIISSEADQCAGTIDLIATVDGKLELFDYKFRDCKGKVKTYDKDLEQLAIESQWVKDKFKLDYLPAITTVCVDSTTGKCWFKKWSNKMQLRGISSFRSLRYMALHKLGIII